MRTLKQLGKDTRFFLVMGVVVATSVPVTAMLVTIPLLFATPSVLPRFQSWVWVAIEVLLLALAVALLRLAAWLGTTWRLNGNGEAGRRTAFRFRP